MTKPVLMTSYQVLGYYTLAPNTLVCYGGKTGDRQLVEARLLEARAFAETRRTFGGQQMSWWIHDTTS